MEAILKILLHLSKCRLGQKLFGQELSRKLQSWLHLKLQKSGQGKFSAAEPWPIKKKHYAPGELYRPGKNLRTRPSHNNRKLTSGRSFRIQIITISTKKIGKLINVRSIYHEN